MEELQLEESQRNILQTQDKLPHDPNASGKYPGGYTPVGEGVDNTGIEEAPSINVGAVEVTNPQIEEFRNGDVFGSSGGFITGIGIGNDVSKALEPLQVASIQNASLDPVLDSNGNVIDTVGDISDSAGEVEVVDPPLPPVEPPVDPPLPPVDPEDPEEPEDPEDPEEPEEPEDPGNGGGNPGNDKEVGNSPWDGETGASDNPGKGNHQDGEDPETNQPPGDSKNDGGQDRNPQNTNDNGGSGRNVPEKGQNNGWGNGDDDAPGNSASHNNAENNQTSDADIGFLIDRFVEENPGTEWYEDFNVQCDNYESENIDDVHIPDVHISDINFDISDCDSYE